MHLARTIQLFAIMAATIGAHPMRVPQGTVTVRPGKFEPHMIRSRYLIDDTDILLPDGHVILPMANKLRPVGLDADSLPSADSVEMAAEVEFTGPK
ncbi:hypothetical protein LTR94_004648 [Friedmanniomyces endolithicus]|nr:hypothetical protein LTR94_004648 [Friedmanniomyces endolithicus]